MKWEGLKKCEGHSVNIYPRPQVMPDRREATMEWLVYRVDRKHRVVELLAPSGHFKNLAPVIHKFEEAGNTLILDAQLIIDGPTIIVEPRPWGATTRDLTREIGVALGQSPTQRIGAALLRRRLPPSIGASLWPSAGDQQIPQQMVTAQRQILNGKGD
jgi:hypothetical protein